MKNFNYVVVLGIVIIATLLIFVLIFSRTKRESFEIGNGQGKAIMGGDLPNISIINEKFSSAKECQTRCAATNGCTHYTWLGPNTPNFPNTCWLKDKNVGGHVIDWADSYSGTAKETPQSPPQIQVEKKAENPGSIVGNCSIQRWIDAHNANRPTGLPPFQWSQRQADMAARQAQKCVQSDPNFNWSSTNAADYAWAHGEYDEGQNGASGRNCEEVTRSWAAEGPQGGHGHYFFNPAWTYVGCAIAEGCPTSSIPNAYTFPTYCNYSTKP